MSRVDVYGNGDVSLDLHSALLIYKNAQDSQVYVTSHTARVVDGAPTLLAGTPITRAQLADFVAVASKQVGHEGFIHERAIYTAPGVVAWWTPAAQRQVWFSASPPIGERSAVTHHPALLFVARGKSRYVFALAENRRPTPDTRVCQAPYFNVSKDGWICTGNVDIAANPAPADIERYEADEFFRSRFTHPNAPKLINGGSAADLWVELLDGAEFPTERLVSSDMTVAAAIKKITQRS
ncbi:PRTRC system protein B [Burkholderia stagnalis]|uniref:PRTRC system protein B n=1 Tax=Burkholderia stagnalis TaxID=1503054 RepID=UPI000F5DEE25|nr:PRTRC system protein B [Burkholderia stagnalis]RQY60819.1 PRTRC system protein B [Burkholderia stagnalis]